MGFYFILQTTRLSAEIAIVMHKFRTEHLDRHILSTFLYQIIKELR